MRKEMFKRLMKSSLLALLVLITTIVQVNAQVLATYPLRSSHRDVDNTAPGFAWPAQTNANVTALEAKTGSDMQALNPNASGSRIRIVDNSDGPYWASSVTDGYHIDFPVSPKSGFDLQLSSIEFATTENRAAADRRLYFHPHFQVNGTGAWVPLSGPVEIVGTAAQQIANTTEQFYNGNSYVIRIYLYCTNTDRAARQTDFRMYMFKVNGTTIAPPSVAPTATTLTATKSATLPKFEANATGSYQTGTTYHAAKEKGFVWAVQGTTPTVDLPTKLIDNTSAAGTINGTITGLTPNTNYCVRAFIRTQAAVIYGSPVCFKTDDYAKPVVKTNILTAADLFSNRAQIGGTIPDYGGHPITEKGVFWYAKATPATVTKVIMGTGMDAFSDFLKGLKPNTEYCYKAYAINQLGTTEGEEVCFTTTAPVPVLAAIPGSLDYGENVLGGSPITLTYNLRGEFLTPASGNILITVPAGYRMALSASGPWTNGPGTLSVPYNASGVNRLIYVQLPTAAFGTFTGTISHSGGGTTNDNADKVALKGSITQSPDEVSNVGTEFWTGFGYQERQDQRAGDAAETKMSIYISNSGTSAVSATVALPGMTAPGWPKTVTVAPGSVAEVTGFPTGDAANIFNPNNLPDTRLYFTGVTDRGIKITSSAPVSVWMHTYTTNNSAAAAMLFPTNTWGNKYTVQAYGGTSNNSNPNSFFFVIAKDDNTLIEFTPANPVLANIVGRRGQAGDGTLFNEGHTASQILYQKGQTYQLTLNAGQIFNAMGYIQGNVGLDLTGSSVQVVCDPNKPTTEADKKIAVFAGNGRVLVKSTDCGAGGDGSDHLIQQMFPTVAWGTKYVTVPTKKMEFNYFRVFVNDPATVVNVKGANKGTLVNNLYYQFNSNVPLEIESDKPISVNQFIIQGSCKTSAVGNSANGDPEMIIISPVQQAINKVTVYSAGIKKSGATNASTGNYINVIIPKEGVQTFKLNNVDYNSTTTVDIGNASNLAGFGSQMVLLKDAFKVHPQNADYMYATFKVNQSQSTTLSSTVAFNAIAYGMGDGESYGYNAGTALKNLSSIKISDNPHGKDTSSTIVRTCKDNPVKLKIALPHPKSQVERIVWDPGNDPRISPLGAVEGAKVGNVATSTGVITEDGRDFNIYESPIEYKFSELGTYRFTVTAYGTFQSDCGGRDVQNIMVVVGRDNIAIDFVPPSCGASTIEFKDKTEPMAGTTIKTWAWEFGDPASGAQNTNTQQNPAAHAFDLTKGGPQYWIKLTTTNSIGCFSKDSILVDFSGGIEALFQANKDSICPGDNISVTDFSSSNGSNGAITEWHWDFGDGETNSKYVGRVGSVTPPAHTYTKAGTYKLTLQVVTNLGCKSILVDTTITVKPTPVPNFDLPAGVCIPGITLFKNTTTVGGVNLPAGTRYTWNFGDPTSSGNTATTVDGTHEYTQAPPANPGYFEVKLDVISNFGCVATVTKQLRDVFAPPTANFTLPTNGEVCLKTDGDFVSTSTVSANQTITKYEWNFGDATPVKTGASVKHSYDLPGTYTVKLTVTTDKGCISSIDKQIVVAPAPIADFTISSINCVNYDIQFSDKSTATAKPITQWQWRFGDGNTATGQVATHKYATEGTFTATLQVFTAAGCASNIKDVVITVKPSPIANFDLPTNICLPGTATFKNTTTDQGISSPVGATYVWNFDDAGSSATTVDGAHLYSQGKTGGYNVKLTATSASGCIGEVTKNITNLYAPPTANFTLPATSCLNSEVSFVDQSTGDNQTITKWSWKFGDANNSTNTVTGTPKFTYNQTGTYNVTLEVESDKGCKSTVVTKAITVTPLPVPSFTLPSSCLDGNSVTFVNTSTIQGQTVNDMTYVWNFGNPNAGTGNTSTAINGVHQYTTPGIYNITLTAKSAFGCEVTSQAIAFEVAGSKPVPDFAVSNASSLCSNVEVEIVNKTTIAVGVLKRIDIYWDYTNNPTAVITDNSPVADKVYKHAYPVTNTDRTYTIRYVAYSGTTCSEVIVKQITVRATPELVFAAQPGICFEATAKALSTANAASEKNGIAGTFVYSGSGIESDGSGGYRFNPANSGGYNLNGYTVTATFTSNNGCIATATATQVVYPTPVAKWETDGNICKDNVVKFLDKSNAVEATGDITKWVWSFGNSQAASTENPTAIYNAAQDYQVTLITTSARGCVSAPYTAALTVNPLPEVSITMPVDNLCLPNALAKFTNNTTIADGSEASLKYQWYFGDGTSSTVKDGEHTYTSLPTNAYRVQLVATSNKGCIDSLRTRLTLDNLYNPPIARFTTNVTEICVADSILFTDNSSGVSGAIVSWNWTLGDDSTSQDQIFWHPYDTSGNFTAKLIIENDKGCIATTSTVIKVNSYPDIELPDEIWVRANAPQVLNPKVTDIQSNVTYLWSPTENINNPSVKNPTITLTENKEYIFTVTNGSNGCAASKNLVVNILQEVVPPNAFSPNGDGINDTWTIKHLVNYSNVKVEVFDRYGRVVWQTTGYNTPWDGTVKGKPLPTGVYYYVIGFGTGYEVIKGSVALIK